MAFTLRKLQRKSVFAVTSQIVRFLHLVDRGGLVYSLAVPGVPDARS